MAAVLPCGTGSFGDWIWRQIRCRHGADPVGAGGRSSSRAPVQAGTVVEILPIVARNAPIYPPIEHTTARKHSQHHHVCTGTQHHCATMQEEREAAPISFSPPPAAIAGRAIVDASSAGVRDAVVRVETVAKVTGRCTVRSHPRVVVRVLKAVAVGEPHRAPGVGDAGGSNADVVASGDNGAGVEVDAAAADPACAGRAHFVGALVALSYEFVMAALAAGRGLGRVGGRCQCRGGGGRASSRESGRNGGWDGGRVYGWERGRNIGRKRGRTTGRDGCGKSGRVGCRGQAWGC